MPGTKLPTDMMLRVDGSESMMSRVSTCVLAACCTSTSGVCPETVIVSSRAPTFMSALIVAVKLAGNSTLSRTTVWKPVRVKVTLYVPWRRSTIVYRPLASVTADFDFSISAGLAASMVTPGSTPPDSSLTVPAIWL